MSEGQAEILANTAEDGVEGVAEGALEGTAGEAAVSLHV